jgi:flagella basal body P-ring formation protein FlgA
LKKIDIIGRVISRNIALGDIVTTDLLRNEITIYLTNRAYEAGEMIRLEDLGLETYTEESLTNPLTVWPEQTVIATNPLKPGELIRADDVEVAQYVLVAKSTIVNGQVATADLVESRLESVNAYGAQPLTNVNEILGLEATRTIRAGQRLNASDFIAADLVRKNETVRLTIKRGALEITVEAIALENAKIGEQVLLKNPDSGKEIRGIVTGRHAARGL